MYIILWACDIFMIHKQDSVMKMWIKPTPTFLAITLFEIGFGIPKLDK